MKAAPSLLLSCLLVIGASHSVSAYNYPRQATGSPPASSPGSSANTLPSTTSSTQTSTSSSPPTTEQPSTPTTSTTSTTSSVPPTTQAPPAPSTTPSATNNPSPSTTSATPTLSPFTSESLSVDPGGSTTFVIVTNTPTPTSSDTSTATPTKGADDDGAQSGLGTGSIVGISVAGGVAVIAIIAFVVWKFTRKRFTDFDDNEAIKWPELNAHGENNPTSHPLPVHNTGRSGFDTGSEASLSRVASASNYSTPDVASGSDPYAVPPLPHMNPNQPYHDDPTAASGFYDPYRGPVPGSIEHGQGNDDWTGENIPMTQLAGRSSPGPQAAFNAGGYGAGRQSPSLVSPYEGGRSGSPGPQAAYGGRASPGPQAAYGGRASPGPQAVYGGRASPGPQMAYNAGRASPGPQAAYDPYAKR